MSETPPSAPAPATAPPAASRTPVPTPVTRNSNTSAPRVQANAITKCRDTLMKDFRIIGTETNVRSTVRTIEVSEGFKTNLIDLYAFAFRSLWNCGFNNIDPVQATNANAQCALLARNYIHAWFIELYASTRSAVQKKDSTVFVAQFQANLGSSGLKFDTFLNKLFAMMHPVQCNNSLEETLFVYTFDVDTTRQYGNIFNLPNVTTNDLTVRRQNQIIDTLTRTKQVPMSLPATGTSLGSAATLLEFYPAEQNNKTEALSWLNQTDNFNDTDVAAMYIIGTDIPAHRLAPQYDYESFIEDERNASVCPFESANERIINNETPAEHVRGFHVDRNNNEVATYADAADQSGEVSRIYSRNIFCYRKKHLDHIENRTREIEFIKIVKSGN